MLAKRMSLALITALALLVGTANMTLAIRDGTLTTNIPSFKSSEIIPNRLWTEAPMQVLHTFMGANGSMLFVGQLANSGLPFQDRLRFKLGDEQVDSSEPPIDLREVLDDKDLAMLAEFVQTLSYRSLQPCPHNLAEDCIIAVGWNRERTKESGMRWLAVRISEDTYLIVDDSILSVE